MRVAQISALFSAAFLFGSSIFGSTPGSESLILGKFNKTSKAERTLIAISVKDKVVLLRDHIPNPKPSEIAWVNSEKTEIDKISDDSAKSTRSLSFAESPEFQQIKLCRILDNIILCLEMVTNKHISLQEEMKFWAIASFGLTDNSTMNDAITILMKSGRLPNDLPKRVKLGDAIGYTGILGWYGRGIHEYITIPYLNNEIKK